MQLFNNTKLEFESLEAQNSSAVYVLNKLRKSQTELNIKI